MVRHELQMKIHEESDLFSPYDPQQNLLSEDVLTYWARIFVHKHRRMKEDYSLHIISDTPLDEENVRQKIKDHFLQEKEDLDYAVRRLSLKAIILALIGIAVLIVWFIVSDIDSVKVEILCIVGWVGVWEATDIFILERPMLLRTRYHIRKLANAEITFSQSEKE